MAASDSRPTIADDLDIPERPTALEPAGAAAAG